MKDRQLSLFGKLLLMEVAKNFGLEKDILNQISYTAYNRPYLKGDIDFNISHSGSCVILAMSNMGKVGIDIEEVKAIDIEDFQVFFTLEEFTDIRQSVDSRTSFYHWWTQKESLMKADGRGMNISPNEISIQGNRSCIQNCTWYLTPICIPGSYSVHLATSWLPSEKVIDIQEIEFN